MGTRIFIDELHEHIGNDVVLAGWVDNRRDHGKIIFIDLRDSSGKVQTVALQDQKDVQEKAGALRSEYVVRVQGVVKERPENMVNEDEENGDIEVEITAVEVLNESQTPPFEITGDTSDVDERLRLKYRYLDLRSRRLQRNMRLRSRFISACRQFLFNNRFMEIETPLLTKSTQEGSRDFVVPSRLHKGKFYALPQAPQQYKQLLMTAGFERYFQIARAVRDEDLRADRGFEHTQIDLEMSFVEMNDVLDTVESMIIEAVESLGYTVKEKPFPRITYTDAIEKYGDDKFDLRTAAEKKAGNVLAYAWVTEFPFFEKDEKTGNITFSHNPFSMPIPEHVDMHLAGENVESIISQQYDLVCNGFESGGGSIRAHKPEILKATYRNLGFNEQETQERVGHMLEALSLGTPPHGGIALGVERNIMNLAGEKHLREVQAFPMTRGGQTAVMDAPAELSEEQLQELGLELRDDGKEAEGGADGS